MSTQVPKPEALALLEPDLPSVDIDGELQLAKLQELFAGIESQPVRYRQWEVIRHLGTGGMGRVYLARHLELDRRVALKLVKPAQGGDEELRAQRVIREAQALAQLNHENVLAIHQVDRSGERTVIEMEYVEGSTLREWQGGRDWRELLTAYVSAGEGLAAIHAAGLVHRDIKPDNILVDGSERIKVADLGLAVAARGDEIAGQDADEREGVPGLLALPLTATGGLVGTHGYMAPELIAGDPASPASDQFSLAVSLYEALYGTRPFVGRTPRELAEAMKRGELATGRSGSRVPKGILRVLRRALSFEPGHRFPTIGAFVTRLRWRLQLRRRVLEVGAGVFALTSVGAMVWMAKPSAEDPCAQAALELRSVWGPSQRAALAGASSDPALETLLTTLDARTESWATTRIQLCASKLRHVQAPDSAQAQLDAQQDACLDHAQRQLEGLTAELEGPVPAGRYAAFIEAVDLLPACTERGQLESWRDQEDAEELDALLAEVLALHARGDYAGAAALARRVVARSKDHDPQRHADALYRLGRSLGLARQELEAQEVLERARNQAFVIGHDELMCRASAFQAKLDAGLRYDPATARRELGFAEACAQRVGARSPLLLADLLEARGLLGSATGGFEQAASWHGQALQLRIEQLGPSHPDIAKSKLNLANALAGLSADAETIRPLYREALSLREQLYGADHPELAHALHDFGDFERSRGSAQLARELLERAQGIYDTAEEASYVRGRARVHLGLATLALETADHARARAQIERAEALDLSARDLRHERASLAHLTGQLALVEQDFTAAASALRLATSLYQQHDPGSPLALECMAYEIEASYGQGDHARIVALAREGGLALRQRIEAFEPAVRGALAWYAGEVLMGAEERVLAQAYLGIAERSYVALGDVASARELQSLLSTLESERTTP